MAIFGVDAADWLVIDRLIAAGRLPAFARLRKIAATGVLRAEPPLLSPIIWTTMATGRRPEDHGVLDFMVDVPGGGQMPVGGGARRVKALWEIWSNAGRRVLVTGWWATWPADRVNGLLVSDRVSTPHIRQSELPDAGLVFPAGETGAVVASLVRPADIDYPTLSRLLPVSRAEYERSVQAERASASRLYQDPIAHFRAAIATARTYRRISTRRIRDVRPDFWAAYYEIVDTASHLFSRDRARADRAIEAAYEEVDGALAETARALDPETLLLAVSDHGFQPPDAGISEDPADLTQGATAWHRPYGIIAAVTAGLLAGTTDGSRPDGLGTVSPLDIAPTLLARGGLPAAADMPGRVITALAPSGGELPRIASYGAHDLPEAPRRSGAVAAAELERLRALGYVSGAQAVTSLARVNLGEILFRKGDLDGAARELEAVLRADPSNEHASLWLARTCSAQGRTDEALRVYDRLIQVSATTGKVDAIVFSSATGIDVAAGRLVQARARLARVPPSLAGAPEVALARGSLAEAEGDAAGAERIYRRGLQASPGDTALLEKLVDLLLAGRRTTEASAVTTRAAQAYPASPTHLSLAGEVALADRRYRDAERRFRAALALAPDAASVSVELARACLLDHRAEAALAALAPVPASRDAEMIRGAALAARLDWPAAAAAFERAAAFAPPTPELLTALGNAQLQAGRTEEAVKTLERSLALDGNQPAAQALLATARRRKGR